MDESDAATQQRTIDWLINDRETFLDYGNRRVGRIAFELRELGFSYSRTYGIVSDILNESKPFWPVKP